MNAPKVIHAVFANAHRRTCIRVEVGNKFTYYIPMDASGLQVKKAEHSAFAHEWAELPDYAPAKAAEVYMNSPVAAVDSTSSKALAHLEAIMEAGIPSATTHPAQTTNQETVMTKKTTAAAPATASKKAAPAPAKAAKDPAPGTVEALKRFNKNEAKVAVTPAKAAPKAAPVAKASAEPRKGVEAWLREIFAAKNTKHTMAALVEMTGKTESNIRPMLSDLRSSDPRYAGGKNGVLNIVGTKGDDGVVVYSVGGAAPAKAAPAAKAPAAKAPAKAEAPAPKGKKAEAAPAPAPAAKGKKAPAEAPAPAAKGKKAPAKAEAPAAKGKKAVKF